MKNIFYSIIVLTLVVSSCRRKGCLDPKAINYDEKAKKDDASCIYLPDTVVPDSTYEIPETYTFNDVRYDGQIARLQMLDLLSDSVNAASETNSVSLSDLEAIYKNTSGNLFGSSKDLFSKTYSEDQQYFLDLLKTIDTTSTNGSGSTVDSYYVTNEGVEIDQLVQKGLMGAVCYYQAVSYYLENISTDDNKNPGGETATDMEHHFDEAFGYLGVPIDFSESTVVSDADFENNANFWGKYIISMNTQLNNLDKLFEAFRTGRAAISNEDYETRDEAISTIKTEWEKVVAGCVVHYINEMKSDIANNLTGKKYHHWAEGKGFAMCLKYNTDKKISTSDWQTIMGAFGVNPSNVSTGSDLDNSLLILKSTYGFTDSQMINL